jgi:hypothetical protein
MQVFGFDDEKNVYEADLSVEQVLGSMIDPDRVDLFEPNPVAVEVDGRKLYFSPLRKAVFAIPSGDNSMIVCCKTEEKVDCFRVEKEKGSGLVEFGPKTIRCVPKWTRLSRPFEDIFKVWLLGKDMAEHRTKPECLDLKEPAILGQGRLLLRTVKGGPSFCGEMFSELTYSVTLPEPINRIFRLLEGLSPKVSGDTLTAVITGRPQKSIKVSVPLEHFSKIRQCLPNVQLNVPPHSILLNETVEFELDGTKYEVNMGGSKECSWSHRQLWSERENEIVATRVALYDLSRRQTRCLVLPRRNSLSMTPFLEDNLGLRTVYAHRKQVNIEPPLPLDNDCHFARYSGCHEVVIPEPLYDMADIIRLYLGDLYPERTRFSDLHRKRPRRRQRFKLAAPENKLPEFIRTAMEIFPDPNAYLPPSIRDALNQRATPLARPNPQTKSHLLWRRDRRR